MIPLIDMNALQYTNTKWMNNPFHIGEITLQQHENVQERVMEYAPKFIRSYMPNEHRQFFSELPFLVAAIRDPNTGYIWSTLLENIYTTTTTNQDDDDNILVVTSPDPETLHIYGRPVPGDALEHVFDINQYENSNNNNNNIMIDIGLLGIQFESARRNRVNGRIILSSTTTTNDDDSTSNNLPSPLLFKVDQSFGNCPQYIKARPQWHRTTEITPPTSRNTLEVSATGVVSKPMNRLLTLEQIQWIETTETFFTATGYRNVNDPNNTNLRYYGNDSSHRGGPPGFVKVIQTTKNDDDNTIVSHEIVWTEFNGNNHFNSLGNLLLDPHIGLCFPNFNNGGLLQITGTAIVEMGPLQLNQRQVHMKIIAINEVAAGSLPIRWGTESTRKSKTNEEPALSDMRITNIVQESSNVKSFYIQPIDTSSSSSCLVQPFLGGQHLPIQLKVTNCEVIDRRYSISTSYKFNTLNNSKSDKYYRISVKYHDKGKSSSYLHDHMKIGDTIKIGKPNGSFVLSTKDMDQSSTSPIVLISAGIGITPVLSMLYDLVAMQQEDKISQKIIYWIHGARNQVEHPFQQELKDIHSKFLNPESLKIYTLYSRPVIDDDATKDDTKQKDNITIGRITPQYVQQIVPDVQNASFYMCGPSSFLADMTTGLEDDIGVDNSNIFYETF